MAPESKRVSESRSGGEPQQYPRPTRRGMLLGVSLAGLVGPGLDIAPELDMPPGLDIAPELDMPPGLDIAPELGMAAWAALPA